MFYFTQHIVQQGGFETPCAFVSLTGPRWILSTLQTARLARRKTVSSPMEKLLTGAVKHIIESFSKHADTILYTSELELEPTDLTKGSSNVL